MAKILYLYAEVMGYTVSTLDQLVQNGAEIHVVSYDDGKLTPYLIPELSNVKFYQRSEYSYEKLITLASRVNPEIVVVSGWEDKVYLRLCRYFISRGIQVVCGFDDQWNGNFRQHFASTIGRLNFFKYFYSHAWVCGPRQFEYARRLGFAKNKIIFDLYSADVSLFDNCLERKKKDSVEKYPHNFLFVGRFHESKGIDTLIDAWKQLGHARKDWKLTLVGAGALKQEFVNIPQIQIFDFLQPKQLAELTKTSGCFVLPSRFEPWGVVVHEFAAAGLPLVLSDAIGASDIFLVPRKNGFRFEANNVNCLAECMKKIINSSNKQLISMGQVSTNLAKRITPSTSSDNLMSLIENK